MTTRIYTRSGDKGETGLFGGTRVTKDALRVEVYGTVDELNSVIGLARSHAQNQEIEQMLSSLQNDLFNIGADLATPDMDRGTHGRVTITRIESERTSRLENEIDRLEEELEPLRNFILPGGSISAAHLHFARTVCRRAERQCVTLARIEFINPEIVRYLNRLSDLLFVMARVANHRHGVPDVQWEP